MNILKMSKKAFSMIEILLAMGVITVGFMAIVTLLPLGLNTSRDAQESTYINMAVDTVANYLRAECNLFDLSKFSRPGGGKTYTKTVHFAEDYGFNTHENYNWQTNQVSLPASIKLSEGSFSKRVIPDSFSNNFPLDFLMEQSTKGGDFRKYFRLRWFTDVEGSKDEADFDCIAVVGMSTYRSPSASVCNSRISENESYPCLTIRVEWPAELEPEFRKSREFNYFIY
ncbi:MAG: type IV pilus modification PilV family protein [Lentisphaeria bacterium]